METDVGTEAGLARGVNGFSKLVKLVKTGPKSIQNCKGGPDLGENGKKVKKWSEKVVKVVILEVLEVILEVLLAVPRSFSAETSAKGGRSTVPGMPKRLVCIADFTRREASKPLWKGRPPSRSGSGGGSPLRAGHSGVRDRSVGASVP